MDHAAAADAVAAVDLAGRVVQCADAVFCELGDNFSETVYHRALEVEFRLCDVPYASEVVVPVTYRDHPVGHGRADVVVAGSLVVEVKALSRNIDAGCVAQVVSYLRGLDRPVGVVVNFSSKGQRLAAAAAASTPASAAATPAAPGATGDAAAETAAPGGGNRGPRGRRVRALESGAGEVEATLVVRTSARGGDDTTAATPNPPLALAAAVARFPGNVVFVDEP